MNGHVLLNGHVCINLYVDVRRRYVWSQVYNMTAYLADISKKSLYQSLWPRELLHFIMSENQAVTSAKDMLLPEITIYN